MENPINRKFFGFYKTPRRADMPMVGVRLGTYGVHLGISWRSPRRYPHMRLKIGTREFGPHAL